MKKYTNCLECSQEFLQFKADHKYCSDKCRMKAWDKRNPRINKLSQQLRLDYYKEETQ